MTQPGPLRPVAALLAALVLCQATSATEEAWLADMENYVRHYQEMAAFDGVVLIAEGDHVVYHRAFGFSDHENNKSMQRDAVFRIASLSKQFTRAAIGLLIDRDELEFDSKLADFLPEFPNARKITVRQLLDNTAGIAHTNRVDWMDMTRAMTLDEIVDGLAGEPLLFPPGSSEQYSNGGYALLAKIVELAGGMTYDEFIDTEFGNQGYASVGHEADGESVPGMASRYAPGPAYGSRVPAQAYVVANRIGGGSLHSNAEDVFRFFRGTYRAEWLSADTTAALFQLPEDGDIRLTGRSPGALAKIYLDFDSDLTVVTLSSNSAWPASFNKDVTSIYRGERVALTPFRLSRQTVAEGDIEAVTGQFVADRFGWSVAIERHEDGFVFVQDGIRTAFSRTTEGEFHLPIYDWLCVYSDYGMEFECRQRDPDADIRFRFIRS